MRKVFLLLIFVSLSFSNTWFLFYGASKHFVHDNNPNTHWNETHYLKGIAQDTNSVYADMVQISTFKNSIFQKSIFLSAIKKYKMDYNFYYGYQYGLINGYEWNKGGFIPIITPLAGFEFKNFGVDFSSFGREIIMVLRVGF